VLTEHTLAAEELDPLLPPFGSGFLLGLGDLVAQKPGVLDMAQVLEARCPAEVQVNGARQVAGLGVEEAERLPVPSCAESR
jgi:hypothetical protein